MAEMRLLTTYFAQFDGKTTWKEAHPFVERLFHPDLTGVTGKGEIHREDYEKSVKEFLENGGTVDMMKLEKVHEGIRYELVFHFPDGSTDRTRTLGKFSDGRLIRVEPDDPAVYNKLLHQS